MPAEESKIERGNRLAYEHRKTWKNLWSRTDTARWITERNGQAVLLLQSHEKAPEPRPLRHCGEWLLAKRTPVFNVIHNALLAQADRQAINLRDIFPAPF